jgi:hypothetical protein
METTKRLESFGFSVEHQAVYGCRYPRELHEESTQSACDVGSTENVTNDRPNSQTVNRAA